MPLVCVLLCPSLSVSNGTLLQLSLPEANQCSGGVQEVIKGQRVQGQRRKLTHKRIKFTPEYPFKLSKEAVTGPNTDGKIVQLTCGLYKCV